MVSLQAASFFERVLQPRQEARLRLKDKELEHSLNPAWKGTGHKLGVSRRFVLRARTLNLDKVDTWSSGKGHKNDKLRYMPYSRARATHWG